MSCALKVQKFEERQVAALNRDIVKFNVGDVVRVDVKILDTGSESFQAFEGVCIAKSNKGLRSNFTVRMVVDNTGVERLFFAHSPLVNKISVMKRGKVRRAKLYYLRSRRGKSARIKTLTFTKA